MEVVIRTSGKIEHNNRMQSAFGELKLTSAADARRCVPPNTEL
jgi:hypothetical protein